MHRLARFRPSPAMVVAALALIVALGGTSYAAVSLTIPSNTVGTAQLKNNAVVSSKVKNGSLVKADFKAGQLPAGPVGASGAPGPPGPAGPTGPTGAAGAAAPGYILAVKTVTSTDFSTTTSTAYVDVPGATTTIDIPAGETGRLLIRFSAESTCFGGGAASNLCSIKALVDGNQADPQSGNDFSFDATNDGTHLASGLEAHAIDRTTGTLAAGTHTVKLQWQTTSGTTTFRLDDWALIVELVRLS